MTEMAPPKNDRKYKIIIGIESGIILLLLGLLLFSRSHTNTIFIEKEKMQAENVVLQKQLDSLLTEHEKMIKEYGFLTDDLKLKDSTIQAQANDIQKLIASNAGKNQIQKKLDYLRGITQDYVAQIDKLLAENQSLKTEVQGMQESIQQEKDKNQSLTKDKEAMAAQIKEAAVLPVSNLITNAIRLKPGSKKEEIVDKAKRAEKIKISFTLGKNPLVEQGLKTVYVRIARPDNSIIHDGKSFEYDGKQIMYSLASDFYYKGAPTSINLYYEKTDRVVAGSYNISLFMDGKEIGQSTLILK